MKTLQSWTKPMRRRNRSGDDLVSSQTRETTEEGSKSHIARTHTSRSAEWFHASARFVVFRAFRSRAHRASTPSARVTTRGVIVPVHLPRVVFDFARGQIRVLNRPGNRPPPGRVPNARARWYLGNSADTETTHDVD
jgi:hypothetical protein